MAFWRRIHCHFCGARSQHAKNSGIQEFQCQSCEARNYVDASGNIIDTPWTVAAASPNTAGAILQKSFGSFTSGANDPARQHQKQQVFCNNCIHNQRIYNETLANYLPDDNHPRYAEFEKSLPEFKKDLERRYPQICKACAPLAQLKVNRADYYSMTDNLSKAHRRGDPRRGGGPRHATSRDDPYKAMMRMVLRMLGLAAWMSMAAQVWWHAYGIQHALFGAKEIEVQSDGLVFEPTWDSCSTAAYRFQTSNTCYRVLGSYVPPTLLLALGLVWYNPGLKAYYDANTRYGSISGQKQHFSIQLIVLAVRFVSYFNLCDASVLAQMQRSKVIAIHGFSIALMLGGRWLGRRAIQAHKWRLDRRMMPKPDEVDVLGKQAGPAREDYVPQASSNLPFNIFAKPVKEPLRIGALAPQRSAYGSHVWNDTSGGPPPSPQGSDSTIEDPMELDSAPPAQSRMPGVPEPRQYNPFGATSSLQLRPNTRSQATNRFNTPQTQGWEDVRSNLFGIEDDMRAQTERRRLEAEQKAAKLSYNPQAAKSPFYGRLPSAPKSMESRLRNPVSQVPRFKETVTQQQNFLDQMRGGLDKARGFANTAQTPRKKNSRDRNAHAFSIEDPDPDFSPAASRTRGTLDLRSSNWHLPADTANQATGLEDLFGGRSFKISEEPELPPAEPRGGFVIDWNTALGVAAAAALVGCGVLAWSISGLRRAFFLSIVRVLERIGVVPEN